MNLRNPCVQRFSNHCCSAEAENAFSETLTFPRDAAPMLLRCPTFLY